MRYLSSSVVFACAIVCSSPLAAQSTTLTATFSRGAIAEYSGNPNGTDNARLFSSLGIASMAISQQSNNGSWGGTQGNDTSVTTKITFTNGTTTSFPAALNWVKNAGAGAYHWIGLTIGVGTTVADGYPLTTGMEKTYILQFLQSSFDMTAAVQADPNSLDGSANASNAALNALNLYFPTSVAAAPLITGPTGGAGATNSGISINENQTAVTTLTANKAVSWAITGGNDGAKFAISAGGVITFLAAPDHEVPTDSDGNNTYVLTVRAADSNGGTSTQTITVTVLDVDDTLPVVASNQSFNYSENRAANDTIGTVAATDNVAVTRFRFAATSSQTSADSYYTIDDAGVIRVTAAGVAAGVANNDYEIAPNSFTYAVQAGDAANNWSAATNATLNVTDANDNAPVINAGQSFSYTENQAADAQVGTVVVSNAVGVTGFRFSATGTQTSADGYYTIDEAGVVRITAAGVAAGVANNDFEVAPNSFTYALQALVAGNWSASENVMLNVTDLDDAAPFINAGQRYSYTENQSANAIVGTVMASDNVGVSAFRFAATGTQTSADGFYSVDHGGVLRLTLAGVAAGAATNDFETAPNSFTYALEAGDVAGNWSSAVNVTLNVSDANEFVNTPPTIGAGQTLSYAENQVANGVVGAIAAADDQGVTTFRFASSGTQTSGDGLYTIDHAGVVRITAAGVAAGLANNDYEITPNSFIYAIEAGDANGSWSSSADVTFAVTNIADTSPAITVPGSTASGGGQVVSVPEGTTAVTQVSSTVNGTGWAITGGNDQGRFAIDADGRITFTASPDFEAPSDSDTNNSYLLVIEATAPDGSKSTQTITVNVTNIADTAPAITVPGGTASGGGQVVSVPEGTIAVTTLTSNRIVAWSIIGGNDRGHFSINAEGQLSFVVAQDFEAPADSDRNNSYVLVVEAIDANNERSQQTITVIVVNVDELQRKLNEVGANLRGNVRNHAFAGLSSMLSFNEKLLGLDGQCASAGSRRPLAGGVEADEDRQDARLRFARDLSSCETRTRIFVDTGASFSRVDRNWTTRGLASARLEQLVGTKTVLGAALIGTASSDELGSFGESRISDESLQINVYGRTQIAERLRFAAFAGLGRAWYQFRLEDGDLGLEGKATGKRHLYGAAVSGDMRFGGLTVTTDAILSRAIEKLGDATLDASFAGESGKDMLFRLGRVDMTRLSVPVHVPILFSSPKDGREATRLDISPGLLCQDTAADSSALDCGYQLGFKFRLAPTVRSLLRAEARTEAVDGYLLNSLTLGFQRRFGSLDQLSWGMDANRMAGGNRDESRLVFRVGVGR